MKKLIIAIFVLIVLNVNAQLSNPFEMIYYPVNYDSVMNFINDSAKYNNPRLEDSYLQSIGTLYSYLGIYNKAEEVFILRDTKKGYIPEDRIELDLKDCGVNQDTLIKLYKEYNVVLFNEAHHMPIHRAFLYSQLEILSKLGYTHFALEALNKKDVEIGTRAYPISNYPELITGVYINEPVFGNLVRRALELGFTLIPYDSDKVRRDKGQAKNIYNQFDKKDGKLIVLGGYGHIEENFPMMGYHFKNMLKEELLSISQFTQFSIIPVFPISDNRDFYLQKDPVGSFDYYIYSKPKESLSNIPYWYTWMNFKTKKLEEIINEPIGINTLIQLYNKNEINGVPIYQYLNNSTDDVYIAYPQSGNYILKITNREKEINREVSL